MAVIVVYLTSYRDEYLTGSTTKPWSPERSEAREWPTERDAKRFMLMYNYKCPMRQLVFEVVP